MARVLVTGMSGAGKSTLLAELAARGFLTVDTDYDGWTLPNGLWDAHRMAALLEQEPVCVSGTVENQGDFAFDHVVLLSAPLEVLLARLRARTNSPYGKSAADQAEVRRYVAEVEPLLRRAADVELDGRAPIAELADIVEGYLVDHVG